LKRLKTNTKRKTEQLNETWYAKKEVNQ